jgi:hypothetical protein
MFDNKVDSATLTEQSEDANYPAENVQDTSLIKVWRSATVAGVYVTIDAGTGATIIADAAIVAGHNLTASSETHILAGSTESALTAAATIDTTMTYRSGIILNYFTSTTERWWRFTFEDASNTNSYLSVGRLFLGLKLDLSPSAAEEFALNRVRNDNTVYSLTNQAYSDKGVEHIEVGYKFPQITDTLKTSVEAMFDTVGKHTPIFFTNFNTDFSIIEPIYCIITSDLAFTRKHAGIGWEWQLNLREVG